MGMSDDAERGNENRGRRPSQSLVGRAVVVMG